MFNRIIGGLGVAVLAAVAVATATAGSGGIGAPQADPAGNYDLPPGFTYTTLAESCTTQEVSTESGATFPMPEDPDGKAIFKGPHGQTWLVVQHELTEPRSGDYQGDAGKCAAPEQTAGDDDSNGYGSVSRLTLGKDGTTVLKAELITTGLHDLCASATTPWGTFLANEEFPFIADPELRSGWVWEIDPATGAQKRLTGMGRLSHEQEAYAADGSWYLTEDRGDARFVYKFVPDNRRDLTTGELYGLAFNKVTGVGTWVGPLDPLVPDADMRSRGYDPAVWGFVKAEGMVATAGSQGLGGNAVVFSESGAGSDPGRIWILDHLGADPWVNGRVLVEGDWAKLGRPDNLRFTDAGDLFLFEDHGGSDWRNNPSTGGVNQTWVLPRTTEGSENLILFAQTHDEATGPWFSNDNKLLYLALQADPPRASRIIAVRHPGNFNQPYDR